MNWMQAITEPDVCIEEYVDGDRRDRPDRHPRREPGPRPRPHRRTRVCCDCTDERRSGDARPPPHRDPLRQLRTGRRRSRPERPPQDVEAAYVDGVLTVSMPRVVAGSPGRARDARVGDRIPRVSRSLTGRWEPTDRASSPLTPRPPGHAHGGRGPPGGPRGHQPRRADAPAGRWRAPRRSGPRGPGPGVESVLIASGAGVRGAVPDRVDLDPQYRQGPREGVLADRGSRAHRRPR